MFHGDVKLPEDEDIPTPLVLSEFHTLHACGHLRLIVLRDRLPWTQADRTVPVAEEVTIEGGNEHRQSQTHHQDLGQEQIGIGDGEKINSLKPDMCFSLHFCVSPEKPILPS